MTIRDYLDEILVDEKVRIDGKETRDQEDPFAWHIWEGYTDEIPEPLKDLEIVVDGWAIKAYTHVFEVLIEDNKSPLYKRSYSPIGRGV